jgi:hypothetical protein
MWRFLLPTVLVLHLGHFWHFFTEDFRNKPLGPVGYLSGWWFGTWLLYLLFFHMLGIIIPFDELIFFSGVETTNQLLSTSWFMLKNHQLQFPAKSPFQLIHAHVWVKVLAFFGHHGRFDGR